MVQPLVKSESHTKKPVPEEEMSKDKSYAGEEHTGHLSKEVALADTLACGSGMINRRISVGF